MKRSIVFSLVLFFLASFNIAKAQNVSNEINFQVRIFDPTIENFPIGKDPITVPCVILEGHTLLFQTSCDGSILRLVNENNIVYYTVVPTGTINFVLPSYLFGNYEIQIIQDNYCFYGYIKL